MATTPVYTVNNPTPGQKYYAPQADWCVPDSGTIVSCIVKTYDANGNQIVVSSLSAYLMDATTGGTVNSYTYYNGNTVECQSGATNGSDAFKAGGATGQAVAKLE